jgi:hypothetical protein
MGVGVFFALAAEPCRAGAPSSSPDSAQWIGLPASMGGGTAPANRFTYFRKEVHLDRLPHDPTLLFGADSNARLWINGTLIRRKVTRYHEAEATADVVRAGPHLRKGTNVIVVLHHNWGPITTFQRTGNERAGLYLSASWVHTDASWRVRTAPQFLRHKHQVLGVPGTPRIRYPQVIDARNRIDGDLHVPSFDDANWRRAAPIMDGPWPASPSPVETPGQREYPVRPQGVLRAGAVERAFSDGSDSIGIHMRQARYTPSPHVGRDAEALIRGKPLTIEGEAGETRYVTLDFHRPLHGYPFLDLGEAAAGVTIDFGYTEIPRSQYDGSRQVDPGTGWIDPTGVVGDRYADRYVTTEGSQRVEIPDERTARWMTLHIHFEEAGSVRIEKVGIVKSQYPVDWIGTFDSGREHLSQIVKLGRIHAEITMSDAYIDTPGREDGQWYEDARLRAKIAARWMGDTRLRKLMIRTVAESQRPDGRFHDFPPTNYPFLSTYDWTMQWSAILYDQWMWSGNDALLRRYWPVLRRYWSNVLSHTDANGLWRTDEVRADIRVGEHPEEDQSSGIVTPGIIERLRWSAQMADAIGNTDSARTWRSDANRMAKAFREHHVVPATDSVPAHVADRYDPRDPSVDRGFSQAGQTLATTTDLLSQKDARAVLDYTFPPPAGTPPEGVTRWNNPTFSYRALRALSHVDLDERAIRHMVNRYSQYLPDHPANPISGVLQGPYGGPLPEYWISREDRGLEPGEINTAQPVDDTGSHGWAAVPLLWLHNTLLGVRILEPGGGRLRVAPHAGGLPYVQGHTETPNGTVWVSWEPARWTLEVEIPDRTTAEIVLPDQLSGKRIRVEGPSGAVEEGEPGEYVVSQEGQYVFRAY